MATRLSTDPVELIAWAAARIVPSGDSLVNFTLEVIDGDSLTRNAHVNLIGESLAALPFGDPSGAWNRAIWANVPCSRDDARTFAGFLKTFGPDWLKTTWRSRRADRFPLA